MKEPLALMCVGLLWLLAAVAAVAINLLVGRFWSAEAGYALVAAIIVGIWVTTIRLLRAWRLHQPYRPG